jgi:hypothetical protein
MSRILTEIGYRNVMFGDPKPPATCKNGHVWTEETAFYNVRGIRECRVCARNRNASYKDRLRSRGLTPNRGKRKAPIPSEVTCVDCGATRVLLHASMAGRRCRSCARIHAVGTGRKIMCPCGKSFYAGASRLGRNAKFCGIACRIEFGGYAAMADTLRRSRKGGNNPSFQHGRRVDIHLARWRVRHKGEDSCRNCGSRDGLQLHHAIPRGKYRAGRAELLNGLPLCLVCHTGWHGKSVTIYRDVFTLDEWEWLSSQQLTGERMDAWLDRHYPARTQEEAA